MDTRYDRFDQRIYKDKMCKIFVKKIKLIVICRIESYNMFIFVPNIVEMTTLITFCIISNN